ncbi:hypothetical protein B7P43_G14195 [Cryptotermes secundus]|nr:uncharacterized protein LOC111866968 isoform X2 [Cryptotermes secundus]PNF29035.1 hypothetical protein B7P43_G14195 [Cryptotermes secundus]
MNGYSQKILSAKLLRIKQLQNELTDAQFQLNELATENRLLKTLQKRQALALSKYEGAKAVLPQLIRSHNEEVRVLRANIKHLKSQGCEKDHRIKELDAHLQNLRDRHHDLLKLSRERHLGDREQLTKQVEELQEIIRDQDTRIQTLNRKVMLETKNFKYELSTEMARHKKTKRDLTEALDKISKLEILVKTKEKYIATFEPKRNFRKNNRQSLSLVSLAGPARYSDRYVSTKSETELIPRLEEESSEGTCMASNTSYGSTHPSTDTVQINYENHMPSDGYNARRMKIANKRKVMLDKKLHETIINKTEDISSSGHTSPTPSSSVINEDRNTDLLDDNASKHPYRFERVYVSRKSPLNVKSDRKLSLQDETKSIGNVSVDDHKTNKSEDLLKSQNEELLEKDNEPSDTYTKTGRSGSFQENKRKDVFTDLTANIIKETGAGNDSLLSVELKSIENEYKEARKGSLTMENQNYIKEKSLPAITNRSSSRRESLVREKRNSIGEDSLPAVNKCSSRKGSIERELINSVGDKTIPAIRDKSGCRRASLNNKLELARDNVTHIASDEADKAFVASDADETKIGAPGEISQTWNKIQNTVLIEKEITEEKLKQFANNADSRSLETKSYDKKKLLAALRAIDDEADASIINQGGKNSSIVESLLTTSVSDSDSSLNIPLPYLGEMRIMDQQ